MYCKACRKQIDEDSMFCKYCGVPQQTGDREPSVELKWETCEIVNHELSAGGEFVKLRFQLVAMAMGPNGPYHVAATPVIEQSIPVTGFRERQDHFTIQSYGRLVTELLGQGWEITGKAGPDWFSQTFRRRIQE